MGLFRLMVYIGIAVLALYVYFDIPFTPYVMTVKSVKNIGRESAGYAFSPKQLRAAFTKLYPDYILNEDNFPWIPSSTGGLHGSVTLLYASLTEFLALYHAELDTTGSTGRHYMNISVTVLKGELIESTSHISPAHSLSPGDNHVIRKGRSSIVTLKSGTTLLLYGRGFLPLSMGYWISDSLFSHSDIILVLTTIWLYMKALFFSNANLWTWINEGLTFLWKVSENGVLFLWKSIHYHITHLPEMINSVLDWCSVSIGRIWESFF